MPGGRALPISWLLCGLAEAWEEGRSAWGAEFLGQGCLVKVLLYLSKPLCKCGHISFKGCGCKCACVRRGLISPACPELHVGAGEGGRVYGVWEGTCVCGTCALVHASLHIAATSEQGAGTHTARTLV